MLINMKSYKEINQTLIHILDKSPIYKILLLLMLGVLYIPILKAQNSNFWDLRKERTEPLPYGETIVLKDSFEGPVNSISVTAIYGLNKQTGEVSIDGNTWTALVGPFPVRTNVIFIIHKKWSLSDNDIGKINGSLVDAINQTTTELINSGKHYNGDSLVNQTIKKIGNKINDACIGLTSANNQSAKELILAQVRSLLKDNVTGFLGRLGEIEEIKSGTLFKAVKREKMDLTDAAVLNYMFSNDEKVQKANTSMEKATFENLFNSAKEKYDTFMQANKELNEKIISISNAILKEAYYVRTESTSQETSGVQSYIGVDLGLTYVDELSATPFFITLSPYLAKIDPEKDYKLNTHNLCKFGKSLLYFITPSFGIGIGNTKDIKPVYFAGMGCRLNKMARITVGGTYFTEPGKDKYKWCWGFGASISVSYVSDLIKLISSAQSNIKQ